MSDVMFGSLATLTDALNRILPKLFGSGTEQTVGEYGSGQMFNYTFWHETNHAELNFGPWIANDPQSSEYDLLQADINQICFIPSYSKHRITVKRITHLLAKRLHDDEREILSISEMESYYEQTDQIFAARYGLSDGRFIQLTPQVTIYSPKSYICQRPEFDFLIGLVPVDILGQYYLAFDSKLQICGDVIKWGQIEIPMHIDIGQKINELVHLERGILSFVECLRIS